MDIFSNLNFNGLIIGLLTFIIIGIFHSLVIKIEYYFGIKGWIIFLVCGTTFTVISLLLNNIILSVAFGVIAFSCFWSIKEVFEQRERVLQGRFPKNPKRKY
ncbi:MAG: DUF4491 family protein [Bacteroidales bacterium]|jgi:hypothetical protein|nr:DUF4491 family protein [Bacteroidales bacterium]